MPGQTELPWRDTLLQEPAKPRRPTSPAGFCYLAGPDDGHRQATPTAQGPRRPTNTTFPAIKIAAPSAACSGERGRTAGVLSGEPYSVNANRSLARMC